MNTKQIVLSVLALDFLALTAWVVWEYGYLGTFATILSSWPGVLLSVDLLLAIGMVASWMIVDARKHGLAVWPYLLVTLALGSVGPLAYLVVRERALAPRR